MSKTVGIILTVVAVAFAIAVPFIGIPLATAAAISAALSAAIMVNNLLMPKGIANLGDRQAAQVTLQLGEVPRSAIFGEAATAGSLVDAFNYGGEYGTDWEVLIIALADHKSEDLTGFYVNDTFVAFTADGAVTGYNGQLEVYWRDGSAGQTVPSVVLTNGPGWTANDVGTGVAWVTVAYKADDPEDEDAEPVWPGGRPRFLWIVKGKRCYQARKDSTVAGGSGAHRWATPSTWEWTNNPIDCRFNWARGVYALDQVGSPDMLLVGRGLSEAEQPPANVAAPGNLCDELVGGEKQFQIGGQVYANEKFLDVEERFASAVAGTVVTREGAVEIEPAQAKAIAATFTDDELLTGSQVQWNEGILSEADDEWVNTVIPRFVDPDQKWRDHAAPVRRDTADVTADGGPREMTIGLDLVTRAVQAGVTAEIRRRMGRLWGRAGVALPPRFAELEEGDWVRWTSQRRFGGSKDFRIDGYALDDKWHNGLQLREIANSVFTAVPGLSDQSNPYSPTPKPGALVAPSAGSWTLDATTIDGFGGVQPALEVTGAVAVSSVEWVKFEVRVYSAGLGDNDNWSPAGIESAGVTGKLITNGIASSTQYQVSVRYRISAQWTPRRILGPVTTGGSSYLTTLIRNSGTNDLTFSCDADGDVTISAHDRIYADKSVSVNGGTENTTAVPGQYVFIYYDQQSRNGGAVTYQHLIVDAGGDTTDAYASAAHPYRHFVLAVVVPAAGTTDGGSNPGTGGGGTGPGGGGGGIAEP